MCCLLRCHSNVCLRFYIPVAISLRLVIDCDVACILLLVYDMFFNILDIVTVLEKNHSMVVLIYDLTSSTLDCMIIVLRQMSNVNRGEIYKYIKHQTGIKPHKRFALMTSIGLGLWPIAIVRW